MPWGWLITAISASHHLRGQHGRRWAYLVAAALAVGLSTATAPDGSRAELGGAAGRRGGQADDNGPAAAAAYLQARAQPRHLPRAGALTVAGSELAATEAAVARATLAARRAGAASPGDLLVTILDSQRRRRLTAPWPRTRHHGHLAGRQRKSDGGGVSTLTCSDGSMVVAAARAATCAPADPRRPGYRPPGAAAAGAQRAAQPIRRERRGQRA